MKLTQTNHIQWLKHFVPQNSDKFIYGFKRLWNNIVGLILSGENSVGLGRRKIEEKNARIGYSHSAFYTQKPNLSNQVSWISFWEVFISSN